jgi:hypothetical protein
MLITAEQQFKCVTVPFFDPTYQFFVGVLGHVALS